MPEVTNSRASGAEGETVLIGAHHCLAAVAAVAAVETTRPEQDSDPVATSVTIASPSTTVRT